MSTEENKELVRRAVEELWNRQNIAAIGEFFRAGSFLAGRTEAVLRGTHLAMPDFRITIEELIAEDDRVVSRWSSRGTNVGPMMGRPPTGKVLEGTGMSYYRIADGKIITQVTESGYLAIALRFGAEAAMQEPETGS